MSRFKSAWAITSLIVLNSHPSLAQVRQHSLLNKPSHDVISFGNDQIIDAKLSYFVRDDILARRGVKGMALTIIKPNNEVEYGTWGVRSEKNDEVIPDTLFYIASCSKAFLATSIGIVMEDYAFRRNSTPLPSGLAYFDWDTKMKDLLPNDWELLDRWASEFATVRDVLSHVSGLPAHDHSYSAKDTQLDVIRRMRHLQPTFELREKWSYNNQMYMAVAYLLSTLTGKPYPEFVRERIFDPLGIPESGATFSPAEAEKTGNMSQAWYAQDNSTVLRIPFWFDEEAAKLGSGPGGVFISAQGLWLKVLLNKGIRPDTNSTVIPRSVYDAVTTSTAIIQGEGTVTSPYKVPTSIMGYGMGWSRQSIDGHELVEHTGGIPGFKTFVGFFPEEKLGIAVTYNTELGPNTGDPNKEVVMRVMRAAFGTKLVGSTKSDNKSSKNASPVPKYPAEFPKSLADLAGTYANKGCGNFTLCAPSTESDYCDRVRTDFERVDSMTDLQRLSGGKETWIDDWKKAALGVELWKESRRMTTSHPGFLPNEQGVLFDAHNTMKIPETPNPYQLQAAWPRFWTTHLRAVYLSSSSSNASTTTYIHTFAIQPTALFPDGFRDSSSASRVSRVPFEVPVVENEGIETWAIGKFVVEDGKVVGVGMSGDELVPPDATRWMKERQSGDVKKDSLVWFDRID